jgi:2-polyprenyl-6-hydroxyphenyl methylase/3-demethylubiquinone-9 3-methyltransferase
MAEAGLEVAKLHLLESDLEVDYQKIPVEAANLLTSSISTLLIMLALLAKPLQHDL